MSKLPICDIRLDEGCGVCYECQNQSLKAQVELLEKRIKKTNYELKTGDTREVIFQVNLDVLDQLEKLRGKNE